MPGESAVSPWPAALHAHVYVGHCSHILSFVSLAISNSMYAESCRFIIGSLLVIIIGLLLAALVVCAYHKLETIGSFILAGAIDTGQVGHRAFFVSVGNSL